MLGLLILSSISLLQYFSPFHPSCFIFYNVLRSIVLSSAVSNVLSIESLILMNLWGEIRHCVVFFFRASVLALMLLILLNFISCSSTECCLMVSKSWAPSPCICILATCRSLGFGVTHYWKLTLCRDRSSLGCGTRSPGQFFICFCEAYWAFITDRTNLYINFSGRGSWLTFVVCTPLSGKAQA